MTTKEMISELKARGYKVKYRKRTDGGYLITKIDGRTFTGAKGNTYARSILGTELSQKRQEQLSYNVDKYIKAQKKKATLDEEMKKELRKVQRKWRKRQVKGRITAKKVKEHIATSGREEAKRYLQRQTRYGEGLAYEENVEGLAQYIEDVSLSISDRELAEAIVKTAMYVRSKINTFKEEWISVIYGYWYEVIETHFDLNTAALAITKTYAKIN